MISQDYVLLGAATALLVLNWLGAGFTIRRLRTRGNSAENRTGGAQFNVIFGQSNVGFIASGVGIATVILVMIAIGVALVIVK